MSKNTMKLGIVCPYDYFRHGGVQEHIRAVASELRSRGHEVKIITPLPPSKENPDPENVITIGRSTVVNGPSTSFEISVSASTSEIQAMLDAEKFDIINYHEPAVPMLSSQILSRSEAVNVATLHARMPDTIMNKPLEMLALLFSKNSAKHFDAVTAVSEAASYHVSKITDKEINMIPNGIELEKFNPKKVKMYEEYDDDVKTILYIGRLEKRKGVEHLVKAYRKLKKEHENVRLVICGDGPRRQHLEEYVEKYELQDVHFPGFISEEDKLSLLKTCDVFCSPALYGESFGIVLVEAMAMGAPIIAGENPGYISVMKETGRLALVNPKDTLDFRLRLELLLFDKKIRKTFTDWEKEYVQQFDYPKIADKYMELYDRLLG